MAENVAKVTLEVGADTSKVAGQVAAAKAQVEASAAGVDAAGRVTAATNAQTAATSRLGEQLKDIKKTYGEQVEVVQGLIGKLFAVGAVTTTFYKIGEVIGTQIVDKLTSAADKANDFLMTVNRADAKAAIKQISDRVQVLNAELASTDEIQQQAFRVMAASGNALGMMLAKDGEKILEERKRLVEQLKGLSNQIAADEASAESAAARAAGLQQIQSLQQLTAMTQSALKDAMSEEDRIRADAEEKRLAISAAYVKLSAEQRLAVEAEVLAAIAALNAKAAADIEERRRKAEEEERKRFEDAQRRADEEADKYRKWLDEQDKAARRVQQSWSNAYRAIREESNRAFATDQAASMVQLAAQLRMEGTVAAANMNQIIVQGVG